MASPKIMGKLKVGGEQEEEEEEEEEEEYTHDGTVDLNGRPAIRKRTGKWFAGFLILVNQGLATLAFFGVGVNLVLFMTRVLQQENAAAANTVSIWTGTVYMFSLVGAFLSDSYWGRYKTCVIFQTIFVIGLVSLSLATHGFLLNRRSCGDETIECKPHSSWEIWVFYLSIYTIALGNGGYQPNIATFGADQFDEEDAIEGHSKVAFFSYFYLALNLGQLFSDTVLTYFEDEGMWALGFWVSAASAFAALVLFLGGTKRYRHFKPSGNPITRFAQVIVAATKKWKVEIGQVQDAFHDENQHNEGGSDRHLLHSDGFRFLDRAAVITPKDLKLPKQDYNPWRLCTVSQVEEVKCILRLLPIWLCTILYSVVFTQMSSLFVEQGAAMKYKVSNFEIPPASMCTFDIVTVAIFIFIYRKLLNPIACRIKKNSEGLTELQRMGIGLVLAIMAMVSAGLVEFYRLKYAREDCTHCRGSSSLSIFWQVPQYALIGASEVFMYVGQLEFFNAQAPDGLKSFGSALCMTSISLGNYASSLLVTVVVKVTTVHHLRGWIPENLNDGHLDWFYFLLAGLTGLDLVVYVFCAKCYKNIRYGGSKFVEHSRRDCVMVV